jgi:hypothetical protein
MMGKDVKIAAKTRLCDEGLADCSRVRPRGVLCRMVSGNKQRVR